MKTIGAIFGVLLICFAVLMSAACPESSYHKANRAAKQIADDLSEFEKQVENFHVSGDIDDGEAANLANLAKQAATANDAFVAKLQTIKTIDSKSYAQVVQWIQDLADTIQQLNSQGVLHLKSQKAQHEFAVIYASIDAGLTVIQGLMGTQQQIKTTPTPMIPNRVPLRADVALPAAIALAIQAFNALAKLILQYRQDGQLTDAQLQAAAVAEDQDTENHAAAFIASLEKKSSS